MSDTVRFGILSFALYHADFWSQAINESPKATLAGIWDEDPQRGAEASQRYGTRYWPDLSELLSECDAVGITSETVNHAPLVEAAAAAGVHILCEKPMATTLEDCDRIERAVRAADVIFMQNFPKRYDPINHELVELVQRGDLGEIALVRVRHGNFHGLESDFVRRWAADPSLSGGGALIGEGVHAADFLLWLLGEPEQVNATISRRTLNLPVEDTALAVFTFPSGVLAEVSTSFMMVASEQSVEVYGTQGSALLSGIDLASRDFSSSPYLRVFHHGDERGIWRESNTTPFFKRGNFHQQGPWHFIECVRGNAEPVVGLEEGRKSLEMILAAYQSAESGQPTRINLARDGE